MQTLHTLVRRLAAYFPFSLQRATDACERQGYRRAARLGGSAAALPIELRRCFEEQLAGRMPLLPLADTVAGREASEQLQAEAETQRIRHQRRLAELTERRAAAAYRLRIARRQQHLAEAARAPATPPPAAVLNYALAFGLGISLLLLLAFYLNASYLAFYANFSVAAQGTDLPAELDYVLNGTALFRPDLLPAAVAAGFPVLIAGFFLSLELVRHLQAARERLGWARLLFGLSVLFDGVMAYCIHVKLHEVEQVLLPADHGAGAPFYTDPLFWVVSVCGLACSFLLEPLGHAAQHQYQQYRHWAGYRERLRAAAAAVATAEAAEDQARAAVAQEQDRGAISAQYFSRQLVRCQAAQHDPHELARHDSHLRAAVAAFYAGWCRYVIRQPLPDLAPHHAAHAAFCAEFLADRVAGQTAVATGRAPLP